MSFPVGDNGTPQASGALAAGLGEHLSETRIEALAAVCVGIAGAGGLGSNVAAHLVRTGIRRLVIADFDRVTPANLNRQFYFSDQVGMKKVQALAINLQRIRGDLALQALDLRLTPDNVHQVFEPCHMVVEALDDPWLKRMMAEAFMADSRLLVCASGIGGWGDSDRIRTRRLGSTSFLIGDERSEISCDRPATSAIVGLAAAKQADVVVETILNGPGRVPRARSGPG